MSDSNAVSLAFVQETTFGEVPSGPPTLQSLRFTSENLKLNTSTVTSQEIRSDRQIPDFIRTNLSAAGDLNWEFSYGTYDEFMQAALLSAAWTTPVAVSAATISLETIATSSSSNPKVKDSSSGFGSINVNQWIEIEGATPTGNNVYAKVLVAAAGELEIQIANAAGDFAADEAAGATIVVTQGAQILNGTTFRSFVVEKEFTDLTNILEVISGLAVDTMSMAVNSEAVLTGSFGFMGKNADGDNSSTIGDGSNTAASTTSIMNAIDNVVALIEGVGAYDITEFAMNASNNLRQRLQVGTLGPISIGKGTINVTGNMNAYFEDQVALNKYRNFTATALAIVFQDTAGNGYVFDFPRVKYSDGDGNATGINTDVMANIAWQAYMHETELITWRIARFAA